MSNQLAFLLLVFAAVIFLSQSFFISVYSPQRAKNKLLKKHLNSIVEDHNSTKVDLVLENRLEKLSALARTLESIEWVKNLTYKLQLSGSKLFGHQYTTIALGTAVLLALITFFLSRDLVFSLALFAIVVVLFHFQLKRKIDNRMQKMEEQFPEALDVLKRGLQAGYAFSEALKLVCEETQGELSEEFHHLFNQINYGTDVRTALVLFVQRVPTTSAMAFASSVSIQKETGGNLAEKVEGLSDLIRKRFKFKRKVRTLTAEGRMSGWVLVLTPFVLFAVLYMSSPGYISTLTSTPDGLDLLKWGGVGMVFGIWWIGKLIKIDV
ncbi:type II secretion system F family protein [Thalassotalea mangrovi]|uniref:Type II secretion system F family protein n=1 Tax=Thalassotalea mangrovi TaxID=2572245 RepID=A0A4U1B483_9GAMM|nr:type II secretion system F family protein [Thalassotalea mangrovi]TKB44233.1 type II secretion system F family protein [Thalassotalea mangrovi]